MRTSLRVRAYRLFCGTTAVAVLAGVVGASAVRSAANSVVPIDLGSLGASTVVNSVSPAGQFVGYSTFAGATHAFSFTQADGMVDLGVLPGGVWSSATAVNNRGEVAGMTGMMNGDTYAFVWTKDSGMVGLGTITGGERPNAISNSGQVVGSSRTASGYPRAFSWTPAEGIVDLGTLGGPYANATGVNNEGQVVGWADTRPGETHAFLWTAGSGMRDLGTLGGVGTFGGPLSQASAISDNGVVVGASRTISGQMDAFSWTAEGGMIDIAAFANATAVSGTGQVIGYAGAGAFSWTAADGLSVVGGRDTRPSAVTRSGLVVGMTPGAYGWDAFIWTRGGGMTTLEGLEGGTTATAVAASESGQVFGYGWIPGEQHALFWQLEDTTPPAAPSRPDLATSSDTGASHSDNITKLTTLTFTGTAEPGTSVTLYRNTLLATTIAADETGAWTASDTGIVDGAYDYTASATDGAGNTSTNSDALTVTVDTSAPVLHAPPAVSADATSPTGGTVEFSVDATDPPDGNLSPTCNPPTGAQFAIGVTSVLCSAADLAGNGVSTTFDVHVRGALEQLDDLIRTTIGLSPGTSLGDKAHAAQYELATGDTAGARERLHAFTNEVVAQVDKKIADAVAKTLVITANRIVAVIG